MKHYLVIETNEILTRATYYTKNIMLSEGNPPPTHTQNTYYKILCMLNIHNPKVLTEYLVKWWIFFSEEEVQIAN